VITLPEPARLLATGVERNAAFYRKFGFNVTSPEQVIGIDTRFMWRMPGRRRAGRARRGWRRQFYCG
jgi:hypothetical protein